MINYNIIPQIVCGMWIVKMGVRKCSPLWKLPLRNLPPRKFHPGKISPNEIPSPLVNHINERKNKITKFLAWRKLCNTTSLHTGLRYFLYRMKKIQKSNESANRQVAFTCQLYKSRRTETRQSNYKIWQIGKTTK